MFYLIFLLFPLIASGSIEMEAIGKRIWMNECGGKIEGLVTWNANEECLSLGIGHFIWYPENSPEKFDAMFPKYVAYLKKKGEMIPDSLASFPWKSREDFLRDAGGKIAVDLRNWLSLTIDLQTEFIVQRLFVSLEAIFQNAKEKELKFLKHAVMSLVKTNQGLFALIDYLNFKGEGLSSHESYQGKGWGLYQVLLGMEGEGSPLKQFQRSAVKRLTERVSLAPMEKNESRWLQGWKNRIESYSKEF